MSSIALLSSFPNDNDIDVADDSITSDVSSASSTVVIVVIVVSAALSAASASMSRAMRSVLLPDCFKPRAFNNSFRDVAVCCHIMSMQ